MERKFTKQHNELDWLFPEVPNACVSSGEAAFNEFENMQKIFLKVLMAIRGHLLKLTLLMHL